MKTAVIYARYSSDNQTEQSIEGQLRVCEEYAQKNNILILGIYRPCHDGYKRQSPGFSENDQRQQSQGMEFRTCLQT